MTKPIAAFRFGRERDAVVSAPVLDQDRCYFHVSGESRDLVCLRMSDGAVLWRRPSEGFRPIAMVGSTWLLASARELKAASADGVELWRRPVEPHRWRYWDQLVVVAANPLRLVAVGDGSDAGTVALASDPAGLVVSGDTALLWLPGERDFTACDLAHRRVTWSRSYRDVLEDVPLVPGAEIVAKATGPSDIFALSFRHHLFGFDVASGESLWRLPIRCGMVPTISADAVTTWHQPDPQAAAHLIRLAPRSGEIVFDRDLSSYAPAFSQHMDMYPPAVAKDVIVLATRQGMLCACAGNDGALLWQYQHKHALYWPTIVNDTVIVMTADGYLLQFPLVPSV